MVLELIASGLSVVASVASICRNQRAQQAGGGDGELEVSLRAVQARVAALEGRMAQAEPGGDTTAVLGAYEELLNVLRGSRHFSGLLEFLPTDYGTWKLVRRNTSILRDPEGEFGDPSGEQVYIDHKGRVENVEHKQAGEIPELPGACRCKDRIDIREIVAFETVCAMIARRGPGNPVRWLDLCCGNGNVLGQIRQALGESCGAVEYHGVDLDLRHIEECRDVIRSNELADHLAAVDVGVHDVSNRLSELGKKFDIVTLLNVLHELPPFDIYRVIGNAVERCKRGGVVLIVDMCALPHLEWRAITWSRELLARLVSPLFGSPGRAITVQHAIPVSIYPRTVDVVSVKLPRSSVNSELLSGRRTSARTSRLQRLVRDCLEEKRRELSEAISVGGQSGGLRSHNRDLQRRLWEFWAVSDALDKG